MVPLLYFISKIWDIMIPKLFELTEINVQVQGPAKEIEPLKEKLEDADFYVTISGF